MDMSNNNNKAAAAAAAMMDSSEVEKVFNRFDENHDGKISASELGKVVRALGSPVSEQEVEVMIQEMDSDRDGFVDIKEFADFHATDTAAAGGAAKIEDDLKDAFHMYDSNGDGKISTNELHLLLQKLGDKSTLQDCHRMIKMVDSDGDGFVNFQEFKKMMGAAGGPNNNNNAA